MLRSLSIITTLLIVIYSYFAFAKAETRKHKSSVLGLSKKLVSFFSLHFTYKTVIYILKRICFYILGLSILNSCGSYKTAGTYRYIENKNKSTISERLTLKENHTFEYYVSNYTTYGPKNDRRGIANKGKGVYKIKNDSIYLNFKRSGFEFDKQPGNLIREKFIKTDDKEIDVTINFFDSDPNIIILNKGSQISRCNLDGVATFKIDKKDVPTKIVFDFSQSDLSCYNNYSYQITEASDLEIDMIIGNPIHINEDLVFPVYRTDKNNWKIGRMDKDVL